MLAEPISESLMAVPMLNFSLGVVDPMPTLPSIINPFVGAAVVSYEAPNVPPPDTLNFDPGAVSPMPTLPSIINPPVGAAVVSYPLPKLPPPLTLNIDPGAVSPMPTLPELSITNLSVVPSAVEDAMEKRPFDTSYPIVQ